MRNEMQQFLTINDLNSNFKIGMLLVCGLPASGKTTFCKRLRFHLFQHFNSILPILIHFDNEIGYIDFFQSCDDFEYKNKRTEVYSKLNILIEFILNNYSQNDSSFVQSQLVPLINKLFNNTYDFPSQFFFKTLFIILDDTFYFKSMRYKAFQISLKCISFLSVFHSF